MSESLIDTCKRSLGALNVQMHTGLVTKVAEGTSGFNSNDNPYIGKKITIKDISDGSSEEESADLVLWAAGGDHGKSSLTAGRPVVVLITLST